MAEIVKNENLEVLHPEYKTSPRLYYKNLYRYTKCFIGGDVAFSKAGTVDCAEGAKVVLFKGSNKISEALTDNYGDFKLDHLDENSGSYRLEIEFRDYAKKTLEVDLKTSQNVGTILFQ